MYTFWTAARWPAETRPVSELYEWPTWLLHAFPVHALYPPDVRVTAPVDPHCWYTLPEVAAQPRGPHTAAPPCGPQ